MAAIAFSLLVATFVSEDAAFLSSLLLAREGTLPVWLAIGASATGIWVGDAGLFFLGRFARETKITRSFVRKIEASGRLRHVQENHAGRIIFLARFIPGARLPVYLGAGFARVSIARFLIVSAVGVSVWMIVGAVVLQAWDSLGIPKWIGFVALATLLVLPWIGMSSSFRRTVRVRFYHILRLRHFEFWPILTFYPPVILYLLWLSLRYRSLRLPLYANPRIPNSGMVGESKFDILREVPISEPALLRTRALDCPRLSATDAIREATEFMGTLSYPVILKPDAGQRGSGVRLIPNEAELRVYLEAADFRVLIQEYCPFGEEVGVNYVRYPGEVSGKVTGITRKRFPSITGDGIRSLADLILADPRARLIARTYFDRHANRLEEIIPVGESVRLVESGNHCQGTIFENGGELLSAELSAAVDRVALQIPDFHVGRFDLRFENEASLRSGKFRVIELNGAAGEATEIYDRRNTLRGAYRTLFGQLRVLFEIGSAVRARGNPPKTNFIHAAFLYRKASRNHPLTT